MSPSEFFTITPEVITHWYVWDVANHKLLPGPQTENQWLPLQPVETQTQYIAAAMKMLRDVGLEPGGVTMCWSLVYLVELPQAGEWP